MNKTAVVVLSSCTLLSTAQGFQYTDNFQGSSINTSFWQYVWGVNGLDTYQNGALYIQGTATANNYLSQGAVGSGYIYPPAGLSTSASLVASGSGTGWWAGINITDGPDALNFFVGDAPLPTVGYTYYQSGVGYFNTLLSNHVGTNYGMSYSGGVVDMYMDGQLLASQPLSFGGDVSVELGAAAPYPGSSVNAAFTDFRLSTVPGPSSTAVLGLGLVRLAAKRRKATRSCSVR